MSDQTIPTTAKVVIVGGGIVGCSVLYHLAKLGWKDIVLLEKLELTAGSTWHAAGNVTLFGHYPSMLRMQADAINTYQSVAAETDQDIGFHQTGSLRLATNEEELAYYHKLTATYEQLGIRYQVLTPEEIPAIHPLLELEGVLGAVYTPDDGYVDPSGTTHALAKAAKQLGAKIYRHCPVEDLNQLDNEKWTLSTPKGKIECDHVVMAASFWSRELALKAGVELPLYPLEHHEMITDSVTDVQALTKELPSVRDPWGPNNIRQEGQGFLIGCYESVPKPWAVDGIPKDFGQELLAPDMDRIEPHLLRGMERIPALGNGGIKAVNNGPICYTPDTKPLIGPHQNKRGFWLASGFAIGIGHGGGAGRYLAEWIDKGVPPYELFDVDPCRFGAYAEKDFTVAKMQEGYIRGYDLPVAYDEPVAGRNARLSALHDVLQAKGAHFGVRNGWERPLRFSGEDCELSVFNRPQWMADVKREAESVIADCGILDASSLARYRLTGADLRGQLSGYLQNLPEITGEQRRAYILNSSGKIALILQVAKIAEDDFLLICEAEYEQYLGRWLFSLQKDNNYQYENITDSSSAVLIAGPNAEKAIKGLMLNTDLGASVQTFKSSDILLVADTCLGVPAWYLCGESSLVQDIYVQLSGIAADVGFYARSALMLQTGVPQYGKDITCEDVAADITQGKGERLWLLQLKDNPADALGGEALQLLNGETVGMVCSGGWTPSGSLAIARIQSSVQADKNNLQVLLNGKTIPLSGLTPIIF